MKIFHWITIIFLIIGLGASLVFIKHKKNSSLIEQIEPAKKDKKKILSLLKKAFADEWLAYYQYWIGALVITGPSKEKAILELYEHAEDELRHAKMLGERIIALGGTPILEPQKWYTHASCGYDAPTDPYIKKILEQNINGERCAIKFYTDLLKITADKDAETHKMIESILKDEIKHEQDLLKVLNNNKSE